MCSQKHFLHRSEDLQIANRTKMGPNSRLCERYEHEIDYRLWDIGSRKSL
jgi:hypothetical protein